MVQTTCIYQRDLYILFILIILGKFTAGTRPYKSKKKCSNTLIARTLKAISTRLSRAIFRIHRFSGLENLYLFRTDYRNVLYTPHKPLSTPLKCKIFFNFMKNGTFAPEEQIFYFPEYLNVKLIFWKIFENLNYL